MPNNRPYATRIFYPSDSSTIVLEKEGHESLSYQNTNELIETHIKGLLAIQKRDGKDSTWLLGQYHGNIETR